MHYFAITVCCSWFQLSCFVCPLFLLHTVSADFDSSCIFSFSLLQTVADRCSEYRLTFEVFFLQTVAADLRLFFCPPLLQTVVAHFDSCFVYIYIYIYPCSRPLQRGIDSDLAQVCVCVCVCVRVSVCVCVHKCARALYTWQKSPTHVGLFFIWGFFIWGRCCSGVCVCACVSVWESRCVRESVWCCAGVVCVCVCVCVCVYLYVCVCVYFLSSFLPSMHFWWKSPV